jgi:hypothetical protein
MGAKESNIPKVLNFLNDMPIKVAHSPKQKFRMHHN